MARTPKQKNLTVEILEAREVPAVAYALSDFNIVYVLTHGGPINSTHLFATLARQIGLESGQIGQGAAISLYLFPVLVLVVWIQLRFVRKQVY